jgi:hypothetical protein
MVSGLSPFRTADPGFPPLNVGGDNALKASSNWWIRSSQRVDFQPIDSKLRC